MATETSGSALQGALRSNSRFVRHETVLEEAPDGGEDQVKDPRPAPARTAQPSRTGSPRQRKPKPKTKVAKAKLTAMVDENILRDAKMIAVLRGIPLSSLLDEALARCVKRHSNLTWSAGSSGASSGQEAGG